MINSIPIYREKILEEIGIQNLTSLLFNRLFEDHIGPYNRFLGREEHKLHLEVVIKGRISDVERKSNEPIALAFVGAKGVRNLSNFMTRAIYDDAGMLQHYQKEIAEMYSHPQGMITGDGCDFPKKGKNSVGVKRQYCGPLGKKDNCQASTMIGYASPKGYGLIDFELYLPNNWFEKGWDKLRMKCRVPEDKEFVTKNQQLLSMIQNAVKSGLFQVKYVGVDCSFGKDHAFLDSLPEELIYFADVPCSHLVFPGRPDMVTPEYKGKGRKPHPAPSFLPKSVSEVAKDPDIPWEDVILGIGSKGPIIAKDKCIRVVEVRDGKPGKDIWLYVRQLEDGSIKYALCNESIDATLEAVRTPALMRWSIEQCFRECKKHLGMDHYEVRTWIGWRRHILFTLIAHLFLNKLRIMFSAETTTPGPAPYVTAPVPVSEYREAIDKAENDEPIDHDKIKLFPEDPQQILTIGLVRNLVIPLLAKMGEVYDAIKFKLKAAAAAYYSHSLTKVEQVKEITDSSG
jgi:SRSO17 transposase